MENYVHTLQTYNTHVCRKHVTTVTV